MSNLGSYQDTLEFLYERLPMFSRIGASAYKKDLTNTMLLCDYFGHPQTQFKSIHIGGTNGKGSTTNYLASMLIASGMKVGVYTSPHLIDFRERIKIGNEYVSEDFVVDFVERAKPLITKIEPSFFELTVVMAFEYFAQSKVDIAMIEVGLGGRLDSTNVIMPELSVVTNVSFDHMNMLGNTIESIAFEKAGIIKKNIPTIIGEYNLAYNSIFENKAKEMNSPLMYASEKIELKEENSRLNFKYKDYEISIDNNTIEPTYQIKNIKTSIVSFIFYMEQNGYKEISRINQWVLDGIQNRTKNTRFFGRWTKLPYQDRLFILESAHNEAGIIELNHTLDSLRYKNIKIVFGCVKDKDISKIISLLPRSAEYIITQATIPRAMDIEDLELYFIKEELKIIGKEANIDMAINVAMSQTHPHDTILITGSIFVVGKALEVLTSWNAVPDSVDRL